MPITLRDYQVEVKEKIYQAWSHGYRNVLLVKPTGMGKTKTFCSIAIDKAILPAIEKLPTAIMVHRKELVQQISLTLAEEGIVHNIIAPRNVIRGIVASQRLMYGKQFYDYNALVTVISVDTLNSRILKHEAWAKSIRLWITDEAAHLIRDNKWGRAVGYFPNALGLGVTATPQRLDRKGLGKHADGVFDYMVMGPTSRWGIEKGHLCDYKIAVPESDYRQYLNPGSADADYTRESMAKASAESHIIGDVVINYQKFANGKQAILFASDIISASRMEEKFNQSGIPAKLLTGETPDDERLQALIDFREKKTRVLINVDLFDEGLDVPGIECVIMGRPTKSLGKYLQMIGRGLRPAPNKPHLIIIDHVGNVPEHGLPDSHRRWTLDRISKRGSKLNLIRICQNTACNSPFDRALTECPYCGSIVIYARNGGGAGGSRPGPVEVDGDLALLDPETLRDMYEGSQLETPAEIAERVGAVAGPAAAKHAMNKQVERINVQEDLKHTIAIWAGRVRAEGWADRTIHKKFFLTFGMTITESLSEPAKAMLTTKGEIEDRLHNNYLYEG